MVAKKRKSKRTTLGQKYKVIKRTKQHHARLAKGLLGPANGKKKQMDNTIPNAWPYKEDLLNQIAIAKEKMEEIRLRQKEKRREEIMARRQAKKRGVTDEDMEEESEDEEEEEKEVSKNRLNVPSNSESFVMDSEHVDGGEGGYADTHGGKDLQLGKNSRRAYLKELRKTVEGGDVVLQVLDARDPLGTLSTAVEEMISSKEDKKLVYVLNKCDLVPRDVLAGWLSYLRRSHPTIPFKSNTQTGQSKNLGRAGGKASAGGKALQTNQAVGTEELIGLLKNYSRLGDTKSVIVVGVVGFPNVGKSSLINSLMRSRAVGVSSMPGYTKVAQEVILDKNIRLMDSPGIVFADGDSSATTLRNCVNVDDLEDVLSPIQAILERCPQGYLMQLYAIPAFKALDAMSFLALVARSTGKLKKGGAPNTDQAARSVLHDWNNGKIKYYCKVPQTAFNQGTSEEGAAKIVNSFSKESELMQSDSNAEEAEKGLNPEDLRVLDELEAAENNQNTKGTSYVGMEDLGEEMQQYDEDDDDMTVASAVTTKSAKSSKTSKSKGGVVANKKASKTSKKDAFKQSADAAPLQDDQARNTLKKVAKKGKKDARRGGAGAKEAYDFGMDF